MEQEPVAQTKHAFYTTMTSTRTSLFPAAPDGASAVYMADYSGTAGTRVGNAFVSKKLLIKLSDFGINVTNQFPIPQDVPQDPADNLTLNTAFGLSGLGGIDVSDDGKMLYVVNQHQQISLADPLDIGTLLQTLPSALVAYPIVWE